MKALIIFLCLGFCNLSLSKESFEVLEAIKKYRSNQDRSVKSDIPPGKSLSDLIAKLTTLPNTNSAVEEIFSTLSNARNSPSIDLVPQLKEVWLHFRKSTFRATSPDGWRFIKALDFSQVICDEIKILVKSMGGSLDDIEPLDERNTYELNEIRIFLRAIKEGPQDQPLPTPEFNELARKLSTLIKSCRFDASNEDDKLHLLYTLEIIQLLGDQKVWPDQKTINTTDSVFQLWSETLDKTLSRIDENWVPRSKDLIQGPLGGEQMNQRQKKALEGTQQFNLRRLREQILLNVSNLIKMRMDDDAFKQEMLKRFSKNDACRKVIEDRLNK
jgi:hypothetical protein